MGSRVAPERRNAARIKRAERQVKLAIRQARIAERRLEQAKGDALAAGLGPDALERLLREAS